MKKEKVIEVMRIVCGIHFVAEPGPRQIADYVIRDVGAMFGGISIFDANGKPKPSSPEMFRTCKVDNRIDYINQRKGDYPFDIIFEYCLRDMGRVGGFSLSVDTERKAAIDKVFGEDKREILKLEPVSFRFRGQVFPTGALRLMQEDYSQMELYAHVFNKASNLEEWDVDKLVRKYAGGGRR